MLKTSAVDLLQ